MIYVNLGIPEFQLMSLEEPDDADAEGLKKALENSISKLELTVDRKDHELGLCSDGAAVNLSLFEKVKADVGDHYIQTWCPSHRLELAIKDAFTESQLNKSCEKDLSEVYYLFRKATLRWRLFKRQALFMGLEHRKYKRPSGTRWVEHQAANINAYGHNLPILIGFFDQQISNPHNASIKKVKSTLEGLRSNICQTERIIFCGVKEDVLSIVQPLSKVLQENSLILPALITCCSKTLKSIKKLDELLERDGLEALNNAEVFPSTAKLIEKMSDEETGIIPNRQTRKEASGNPDNKYTLFHNSSYLLKGNMHVALQKVHREIHSIVKNLHDAFKVRLDPIVEDELFQAMAVFLDTQSYEMMDSDDILESVNMIVSRFNQLLRANSCNVESLKSEFEILYEHVTRFLKRKSSEKTWQHLFSCQIRLGITNILHLAEIAIAMPASNAETERVFSFLWRIFSKDRQSFKNKQLENILRMRCDRDFSPDRYNHAIELFLNEHPNGEIRERRRRVDGHEYPCKRKSRKVEKKSIAMALDDVISSGEEDIEEDAMENIRDIDINLISSDEWTDSESDSDF